MQIFDIFVGIKHIEFKGGIKEAKNYALKELTKATRNVGVTIVKWIYKDNDKKQKRVWEYINTDIKIGGEEIFGSQSPQWVSYSL